MSSSALHEIPSCAAPEVSELLASGVAVTQASLESSLPPDSAAIAPGEALHTERASRLQQTGDSKRAVAIQRAAAEQSRRAAACLRAFQEALLDAIDQPCLWLDSEGRVTGGNAACLQLLKPEPEPLTEAAEGLRFALAPAARKRLQRACRAARMQAEAESQAKASAIAATAPVRIGEREYCVTLLPLCRIPHHVESVLALLSPRNARS